MENIQHSQFVFPFFDRSKLIHYFQYIHEVLKSEREIKNETIIDFLGHLNSLEKYEAVNNRISICENKSNDSLIESQRDILLSITQTLYTKYIKLVLTIGYDTKDYDIKSISIIFDCTAYLLKIFFVDICQYYQDLIIDLLGCFNTFFTHIKESSYSNLNSCNDDIISIALKLFSKLIVSTSSFPDKKVTELILQVIKNLPFSHFETIKCFVHYILPVLLAYSDVNILENVFKMIWNEVCLQLEIDNIQVYVKNSSTYVLLYCLSKHIFTLNDQNLKSKLIISNDVLFWKIMQSGLISKISYTRKVVINIFKTFLTWVKTKNFDNTVSVNDVNSVIFSTVFTDGIKIWEDLIILFEILDEKQVHVIKPVLPKLSRIVQISGLSGEKNILHSSWLIILFQRLLMHENRCIVKWTLDFAFKLDYKTGLISEQYSEVFIKLLIEAMNDQNLFSKTSEQDNFTMFLSSDKIAAFLDSYMSSLKEQSLKVKFLKSLIGIIALQSWSVVSLLHLMSGLSKMSSIPAWAASDLLHVRKIILDCQRSQEPIFRVILENLVFQCSSLFLDWNSLKIEDLADLLIIFNNFRNIYGTNIWMEFSSKLGDVLLNQTNENLNINKAKLFCEGIIKDITTHKDSDTLTHSLKIEKLSKTLIILSDATSVSSKLNDIIYTETWNSLLSPVIALLQSAAKRPYMTLATFISSLQLITFLIKEGKSANNCSPLVPYIFQRLEDISDMIEFIFQKLFSDFESFDYISMVKILLSFLDIMILEPGVICLLSKLVPCLIVKCKTIVCNDRLKKLLLIPLWAFINKLYLFSKEKPHLNDLNVTDLKCLNDLVISEVTQKNLLQECLHKNASINEINASESLSFAENSVCQFWKVCSKIVENFCNLQKNVIFLLVEEIPMAFVKGPKISIPYVIRCFQILLSKLVVTDLTTVSEVLNVSWKACLELRGNEAFRPALKSLIKAIFQEVLLKEQYFDILYDYIDRFKTLSENTLGIFYNVINQFCHSFPIKSLNNSKFNYVPILVHALTFGPIHHKGQKVMEDTLTYIIGDGGMSFNDRDKQCTKPAVYVRITVINYLLNYLRDKNEFNENVIFQLVDGLLNAENEHYNVRTSRFSNSFSHRVRNRAWQVICLLQPNISNLGLNEKILSRIFDSLESKVQQPSIRYLQEWIIFNILRTHRSLFQTYFSVLQKLSEKRPSCIISSISVLCLLISHKILVSEQDILQCFPPIIIQSMAQNFTIRLYAQMIMIKLFSLCKEKNLKNVLTQYEFISILIKEREFQSEHGNFLRNIEKLSADFYFTSFNPILHFSLETIFFDLPKLSTLPPDEWIKPSLFDKECNDVVLIYNSDNNLKNSLPTQWLSKQQDENNSDKSDAFDYNFQKKICPLNTEDLALEPFIEENNPKTGLIIVASLIDRIPNLGGLCRTCEIFGVQELVIGSLKYIEDKQFQTLAVSSDKWVSIKEIKPYLLKDYLITMKDKGYILIGAEQTENSCYLQNFTFPEKSVLLLGHEKEGIPIDLIQLLDSCVEIPQQGVIRSLNVHVTGAILIWEYARQHLKNKTS